MQVHVNSRVLDKILWSVEPAEVTNIHKYFLFYGQVQGPYLYLTIFADFSRLK